MKRKVIKINASQAKAWERKCSELLKRLQGGNLFLNLNDSSVTLGPSECIRAVSMIESESSQRNLLLKCLADAEIKSAGSSFVMLSLLSGAKIDPERVGKRFRIDELRDNLELFIGKLASEIVLDAVQIAGRKGKILLDKNLGTATEIIFGSQICKWKPSQDFFAAVSLPKVSVSNCKVIFIDGIIESVAECHHLLQFSYDKKIPLVIFARGFAEEVISTCAVNFQRQTAQVIPIVIPFDEVGVNAMGDLASCFGSELISSDKGQLISSTKVDECQTALRITSTVDFTEIEFLENKTDNIVLSLVERMKEKSELESDLLRKRIDALGSGSVTIRIGSEQKSSSGITRDRVDFGIRLLKSCMSSGMVDFHGFKVPSSSIKVALDHVGSFESMIKNSGCVLEVDRNVD